ncbi:coiled-coil domain-containing protein [Micromonospora sp. NPDC050187]|uniref:coiled-coil domain-containing protein n=1 Tax=Micromonospora sp. NPDC050187 TaxID=3364277 RepID=UPI00378F362B
MTAPLRRWLKPVVAVLAAFAVAAGPAPALAEPSSPSGHDGEQPKLLNEVIEEANRSYTQAQAKLNASQKRQLTLALEVRRAQNELKALTPQVATIAVRSYMTGRVGPASMLLESNTPDSFVKRASALDEMNMVNSKKVAAVAAAKDQAERAKKALDAEVLEQQKQADILKKRKREAEKSLALVGGVGLTGGLVDATSPVARIGPGRDSNGNWRPLGCTEDDPTTGGCITPRTLHMYKEVKRAGFDMFVGCYRPGGPYEHPKGRACDWSLQKSGFSRWDTNKERMYGNNLTAFLVRNADRLGIYYVIWNKQIWFPATGWSSYSGPSDHTDHVHVSML